MTTGEIRGVIHGRTIVLDEEPGLPDGSAVAVRVSASFAIAERREHRGALPHACGAWKDDDDEGLDEYLQWCREQKILESSAKEA